MGRRGPAPTPTNISKLRGSTLVTKRREATEVKGPAGKPRCPQWLDADSRAAWRQLVPMLEQMGVLTRIDGNALARYCRLWSRWRKAEAFIEQKGDMYPLRDEKGGIKCFQQWPQVAIANKLAQQLTRLEQEFGMTPSARARLNLTTQAPERANDKSRFFDTG
jgi:P27 family predicted phage terminase small subunit